MGLSEKVNGGVENGRGGGWQVWQPQTQAFSSRFCLTDFLQNYRIKSKQKPQFETNVSDHATHFSWC